MASSRSLIARPVPSDCHVGDGSCFQQVGGRPVPNNGLADELEGLAAVAVPARSNQARFDSGTAVVLIERVGLPIECLRLLVSSFQASGHFPDGTATPRSWVLSSAPAPTTAPRADIGQDRSAAENSTATVARATASGGHDCPAPSRKGRSPRRADSAAPETPPRPRSLGAAGFGTRTCGRVPRPQRPGPTPPTTRQRSQPVRAFSGRRLRVRAPPQRPDLSALRIRSLQFDRTKSLGLQFFEFLEPDLRIVGRALAQQDQRVVGQVERVFAISGQQALQLLVRLGPVSFGLVKLDERYWSSAVGGSRSMIHCRLRIAARRASRLFRRDRTFALARISSTGSSARGQVRRTFIGQAQKLKRLERLATIPAGRQQDRQHAAGPVGVVGGFAA